MSAQNPQFDYDVELDGVTYHVYFDEETVQLDPVDCTKHPGHEASIAASITIHEVNDEDDNPLDESVNLEELKTKLLAAMDHMVPECEVCMQEKAFG